MLGKTHTGTYAKDLAEECENKDHTRVLVKTQTGKIAKDLTKVPTKTHTRKHTKDDRLQKTEAKEGESEDRTDESENKAHTRVLVKTHTGKIAKDLTKVPTVPCHHAARHGAPSEGLDEERQGRQGVDNGDGKDPSKEIVRTPAGRFDKDLCKRPAKNHTGRRSPGPSMGGSPGSTDKLAAGGLGRGWGTVAGRGPDDRAVMYIRRGPDDLAVQS